MSLSNRARWIAFSAALSASMMDLLDSTIAQTAAPAIRADLGGSYSSLQWITADLHDRDGGRAAHRRAARRHVRPQARPAGRRRRLHRRLAGLRLAPTIEILLAARVVQGAVGAAMVPQVFGMIHALFRPDEMGKAWGILGPVAGLAAVAGPVVAGLLIDADVLGTGWRAIFLVNLPVGAFVLLAGAKYLPTVAPTTASRRLDGAGMCAGRRRHVPADLPAGPGPRAGLAGVDAGDAGRLGAGPGRLRRPPAPPQPRRRPVAGRDERVRPPLLRVRARLRRRVHQRDVGHRDHARDPHAGRPALDAARGQPRHRPVRAGRVRRLRGRRHDDAQAGPQGPAGGPGVHGRRPGRAVRRARGGRVRRRRAGTSPRR